MVADAWQHGNNYLELITIGSDVVTGYGIFCFYMQTMQVGQHTKYWFAGTFLQPLKTRFQKLYITPKAINDETSDTLTFTRAKQLQSTD